MCSGTPCRQTKPPPPPPPPKKEKKKKKKEAEINFHIKCHGFLIHFSSLALFSCFSVTCASSSVSRSTCAPKCGRTPVTGEWRSSGRSPQHRHTSQEGSGVCTSAHQTKGREGLVHISTSDQGGGGGGSVHLTTPAKGVRKEGFVHLSTSPKGGGGGGRVCAPQHINQRGGEGLCASAH